MTDTQVIVVGAGPAGTSAALALVERGIRVLVLESGTATAHPPTQGRYLDLRFHDPDQWRWLLGEHGEAMRGNGSTSPKLRVPGLQAIFEGYSQKNRLITEGDFRLVGALAPGGLSNAWGCGVATFSDAELGDLSIERPAMDDSYARVTRRMGVSGSSQDDLRAVIGLDDYADPALPLDDLHRIIWNRRSNLRAPKGFALGRARVAVLGRDHAGRRACDFSGTCLWGCANRSTWSAAYDLEVLRRHPLAVVETGRHVSALTANDDGGWWLHTSGTEGMRRYSGHRVLLAAGTIASTRLALAALPVAPARVRLQSNPMAAFLLWLPGALGTPRAPSFGLAQLSFTAALPGGDAAFGNTFSTAGLPVSDFLAHLPVSRRAGIPLLRGLLSSTVVGNAFLPGRLSEHAVGLNADGSLRIVGGESEDTDTAMRALRSSLAQGFRRLGAWMLPGSFVVGAKGADLHYASTMPIRHNPVAHECHLDGQIAGLPGVYAVDGASLPLLPAKAHTLTIMANADRIARGLPVTQE